MTGLDCLREEIIKRGGTKQMAESRTAALVLEILSDGKAYATRQYDIERMEDELNCHKSKAQMEAQNQLVKADLKFQRAEAILQAAEGKEKDFDERIKYIEEFLKALNDCETPEGRDAMRTAQVFVNSVSVDTKYDNTAFIIGLASILSNGKVDGITELKKINTQFEENINAVISKWHLGKSLGRV